MSCTTRAHVPGVQEETEVELQGLYDYDDLAQIMGRMAGGDEAAVVTLYERYGGPIAAAVRRVARHRPGRLADDEVPGVVLEVCFDLGPVAGGWSPEGGALPWVWARHRVANAVDRALGQQFHPLDEVRLAALDRLAAPPPGPASDEPSLLTTLGRMVPDLAGAALLAEALDRGGVSTRDRELFLEYAYEKHSGNAAPAAAVAPVFGMREVSVRQAARRARQRLLRLAASDERFAALADLPLLA
jgi:DNA-directed RNA polymerase specialized sigma24 family protein